MTLVDSIQNQSTKQVPLHRNRSTRPVRARRLTRLDTDLVVTATLEGRTVCLRPVPTPGLRLYEYQAPMEDCQALPYGLKTLRPSTRIVRLICSRVPRSVTMFQICASWTCPDHHQAMLSTWSESENIVMARSIHFPRMAALVPDLHIPRSNTLTMNMIWIHYRTLRVSPRSQGSHQDGAPWCSMSAMTSP
jgi:hypothetical protein